MTLRASLGVADRRLRELSLARASAGTYGSTVAAGDGKDTEGVMFGFASKATIRECKPLVLLGAPEHGRHRLDDSFYQSIDTVRPPTHPA